MARATISNWLALDTWAEILQVNPLFFNSLYLNELIQGDACSQLWQQYTYQNPINVSREEVAQAIYSAERNIANWLGFNLIPDWICNERVVLDKARVPEGYPIMRNVRGQPSSLTALQSKRVVAAGVRTVSTLGTTIPLQRDDLDGDDYDETVTIRWPCPIDLDVECPEYVLPFDLCEIRVYYPGHVGDKAWEIKPFSIRQDELGQVYITLKSWQIVVEQYTLGGFVEHNLDAADDDHYLTDVDLAREYNNVSEQATLYWNTPYCGACGGTGCPSCLSASMLGCLTVRDSRRGILAYQPATWDEDTATWEVTSCYGGRAPDYALINYYAGYMADCPCPSNRMDKKLERAVALYAASLLPRDVCDCENAEVYINYWRDDLAASGGGITSHMLTSDEMTNPFGTRRGAIEAWRIINTDKTLKVSR